MPSRSLRVARALVTLRSDVPLAALDAALVAASYLFILVVRLEGDLSPRWVEGARLFLPFAVTLHLASNWAWGLYGQMWRHASVQEARRVVLSAVFCGSLITASVWLGERLVPISVAILGALLATMASGALRFQSRLFAFRRASGRPRGLRVVVIGAGESGGALVRELLRDRDPLLLPVAILDDDPRKQGRALSGVPVIGGLRSIGDAVRRHGAEQAVLAIPSADGELVRRAANAADAHGLSLKVLPSVRELVGGRVSVQDVRDLQITDLLGRQQIATDLDGVRGILAGKRVLITGAGGSIGSEIARQVAACKPSALLLLDHDETHLYDVAASVPGRSQQLLADIRDRPLLDALFARHRPQVVFHAAAHKHVPLLEDHPCEAVLTNVVGTANVVDAAVASGVERLVCISTDKAVRPRSVMGASKRVGEHVVLDRAAAGRRYCAVRFGNVLGSRGSVVPTFVRQIERGGPVTVTDARMTRFFMSIEEAVQLVLQAAVFADGGEVFMLDMGQPVRILDLAERMIRLSGRQVGTDVPIRITGMRPGEKLAEELRTPEEEPHVTPHPAIVSLTPVPASAIDAAVARLAELARRREDALVVAELFSVAAARRLITLGDDVESLLGEHAWNRSTI